MVEARRLGGFVAYGAVSVPANYTTVVLDPLVTFLTALGILVLLRTGWGGARVDEATGSGAAAF